MTELEALNTHETTKEIIARLTAHAVSGVKARVSLVESLKFRRDQYGLNMSEFAKVLGLQKSHYSEIEAGKRRLPLNATKRAYAVGVPADVLLQMEELK